MSPRIQPPVELCKPLHTVVGGVRTVAKAADPQQPVRAEQAAYTPRTGLVEHDDVIQVLCACDDLPDVVTFDEIVQQVLAQVDVIAEILPAQWQGNGTCRYPFVEPLQ